MRFRWIALGVAGFASLAVVSFACRSGDGSQSLESCYDMVLASFEAEGDDLFDRVEREAAITLTLEDLESLEQLTEVEREIIEIHHDTMGELCATDPAAVLEILCVGLLDPGSNARLWHEKWCP